MRQSRLAFLLIAPAILVVAATTIYPMLSSLWTSLHLFNLSRSLELGRFVGFENYTEAFVHDPEFWPVMRVTAVFVVLNVAITILLAVVSAFAISAADKDDAVEIKHDLSQRDPAAFYDLNVDLVTHLGKRVKLDVTVGEGPRQQGWVALVDLLHHAR